MSCLRPVGREYNQYYELPHGQVVYHRLTPPLAAMASGPIAFVLVGVALVRVRALRQRYPRV